MRSLLAVTSEDLLALIHQQAATATDIDVRSTLLSISTANSDIPIVRPSNTTDDVILPSTVQSTTLIDLDDFRNDVRFVGINGNGFSTVILDSGIDLNHPFFGADADGNGISDRIVYSWDFADNDSDASDVDGHGSNVSSIVASSDSVYRGVAPDANIIHLKVFTDAGGGNFSYVERALQWVVANASSYNIASVNMSLGDSGNYTAPEQLYGIGDELSALAALNVIVASASGNSFYNFGSVTGVSYPSADPNSLSVGAVFDSSAGSFIYASGANGTSGPGRITPFTQRHPTMTSIMAPGAPITGANHLGGLVTMHGTSQASPHIAGIAVLAQQLAMQSLGRRLSPAEFKQLLRASGTIVNDGDDEVDNVNNTGLNFRLVNMLGLGQSIYTMANFPTAIASAVDIQLTGTTQTISVTYSSQRPIDVTTIGTGDVRVTGPNGFSAVANYVGIDINANGSPRVATYEITAPGGTWDSADNGIYSIELLPNAVFDIDNVSAVSGAIGSFSASLVLYLGPDSFGYSVASIPYTFNDIQSSGSLLLNDIDDGYEVLTPGNGFAFQFYGVDYSTIFVNSNGTLAFTSVHNEYINTSLIASPTHPIIAALWDDLDAPLNRGVYWQLQGASGSRQLVLQWSTRWFGGNGDISFQVILHEASGAIDVHYQDLNGSLVSNDEGKSATVGIRGSAANTAHRLLAHFNDAASGLVGSGKSLRFSLTPQAATIVGRYLYYGDAISPSFDDAGASSSAIDPNKSALLPGQTSGFSNYSNFVHGLNGIVIDAQSLHSQSLSAADFSFAVWNGLDSSGFQSLNTLPTIEVLAGQGINGSHRIKLTWPNNQIINTWLRVTVQANSNTGLAQPDIFFFGHAMGDMNVGNIGSPVSVRVNASDISTVRANQSPAANSVGITNIYDVNKDGRVNPTDVAIVRQNQSPFLIQHFVAPTSGFLNQLTDVNRIALIQNFDFEASASPFGGIPEATVPILALDREMRSFYKPLRDLPKTTCEVQPTIGMIGQRTQLANPNDLSLTKSSPSRPARHHLAEASLDESIDSLIAVLAHAFVNR